MPHIRHGVYVAFWYNLTMAYYKGMKVNSLGIPITKKKKRIRVKKDNRKRGFYGATFQTPFSESSVRNLIVMYDIPHLQKKERDWFRRQLIKFGYVMIQKSVWVGPSPLPKEFLKYLGQIKIGDKLKTFKLAKPYNKNEKNY